MIPEAQITETLTGWKYWRDLALVEVDARRARDPEIARRYMAIASTYDCCILGLERLTKAAKP